MATSEYCSCPPRLPTPTASHVAIASGVNHRVTSPRWTRARSYAGQFSDAVFRFVPGMHSRLHVEIMPLRPSRWPGPRRTLVSAHQRQGMRRLRSGAGSIPWSCRIRFTVVRAISWPRFESAPRIRVYPPLGMLDRHPDHARGHVTSRHRPASTAAGAAVVCLGDQSPVPAENRVRRDDAGDLHHDAPAELLAAPGESTALGIGPAKRPRAQVLPEDPILLPEIRDQIVLVAVHPASERENEEL